MSTGVSNAQLSAQATAQIASTTQLELCVVQILCGLSQAVQAALVSLLRSYRAILDAKILELEGELAVLDILTVGPKAVNALAQNALSLAKSTINIVPLNLLAGCVGYADITKDLTGYVNLIGQDIQLLTDDVDRLISGKDEVQDAIRKLQALENVFDQLISAIHLCGGAPK